MDLGQIRGGTRQDCDGNFVPDTCDFAESAGAQYDTLPQTFADVLTLDASALADAAGEVSLRIRGRGDLDADDEFLYVYLDGSLLGFVFDDTHGNCPELEETILLDAETWNQAGPRRLPAHRGARQFDRLRRNARTPGSVWTSATRPPSSTAMATGSGTPARSRTGRWPTATATGSATPARSPTASSRTATGTESPTPATSRTDFLEDDNRNGIPDTCEFSPSDLDFDGCVGGSDLAILLSLWGFENPPVGDLNGDGTVGGPDLATILADWNPCGLGPGN